LELWRDAGDVYAPLLDEARFEAMLAPWLETLTAYRTPGKPGTVRRFFAEAYTGKGGADGAGASWTASISNLSCASCASCVTFLDTHLLPRVWRVAAPWGMDAGRVLERLRHAASAHGNDVEELLHPFFGGQPAHLAIPELGLFVTTRDPFGATVQPAERTLDLRQALTPCPSSGDAQETPQSVLRALAFDETQFNTLAARACDCLRASRNAQRELALVQEARLDPAAAETWLAETLGSLEGYMVGR